MGRLTNILQEGRNSAMFVQYTKILRAGVLRSMTEKIKVRDLIAVKAPTLLAHAVFSFMVSAAKGENFLDMFSIPDAPQGKGVDQDHEVTVEMTVNGVPVSIMPLFEAWGEQYSRNVQNAAARLVKEQIHELRGAADLLHDIEKYIERRAGEVLGEDWQDR